VTSSNTVSRDLQRTAKQPGFQFKAKAVATSVQALFVLALPGGVALAQQAPAETQAEGELAPVIVTGIRASIEKSIDIKRDADGVVESLSAEDIGKLPDTSISESLARLPGLTAQRDRNGNATTINIRGLGPDFNGYLLNGREQTSIGDSRAVDLSVYPAELLGGATVYKTTDATLMTAGLAGTIDQKLIDPLAIGHMVISAQYAKNRFGVGGPSGIDPGTGKQLEFAFVDQFFDRKLGLAVGFAHHDSNSHSLANGSWGNNDTVTTIGNVTGQYNVPFGGGMSFETDTPSNSNNGLAAVVKFQPNKNFDSEIDFFHAQISQKTKKTTIKGATFGAPITNAVVSGNVVQSGTIAMGPNSFIGDAENIFDDDNLRSFGWKNELKFADNWSGSLDVNVNQARRIEKDIEAYAHTNTADTLSFTNGGAAVPTFSFGNPGLYTDPTKMLISDQSGWSGVTYPPGSQFAGQTVPQAGYIKGPTITDRIDGLRLDFKHGLGEDGGGFSDLQFGANYTKRTKNRESPEGLLVSAQPGGYGGFPMPSGNYVANNVGGTGLNFLTFDPIGLWPGAAFLPKYNNDILSKSWYVDEKVGTAYIKGNIDTKWAEIPITGNLGLQIVQTNQGSAGFRANASSNVTLTNPAAGETSAGSSYVDVLPSLNLKGDLGNNYFLRFGLAEQIARPTLTDMRNSLSAAVDTNQGDGTFNRIVGSAGNPYLKPFKATAADLSFEKYFASKAYFSAAVFAKKLETYITQFYNLNYDFTQVANSIGLALPVPIGGVGGGPNGVFTQPINGHGGHIQGYELTASVPLSLFSSWLKGPGFTVSYSDTESTVNVPNVIGQNPTQPPLTGTMPLPGLSKVNAHATVYYERWGINASLTGSRRSQYVGSVTNSTVGGYPTLIIIAPQSWVSAQVGYEFQSWYLKGLGFRLEGNNMNKPVYKELKFDGTTNVVNQTGANYGFRVFYNFSN